MDLNIKINNNNEGITAHISHGHVRAIKTNE